MAKVDAIPATNATRFLKENHVAFSPHPYEYEDRGGTAASSAKLGVDEYCVIKTLIMETEEKLPIIVLMHGNRQVSTKELARHMKVKTIRPCSPESADRASGYQVGGTSPFGTRKKMPIYAQSTILDLDLIYINGGQKGFLVSLAPSELSRVLQPTFVDIATDQIRK